MPERFTNRIIKVLSHSDYKAINKKRLAKLLQVPQEQQDNFSKSLRELEQRGDIFLSTDGRISLPDMPGEITGIFQATSRGFGFVRPDRPVLQGDLFIPPEYCLDAMTGDQVLARVIKPRGNKKNNIRRRGYSEKNGESRLRGRIVKIITRVQNCCVGSVVKKYNKWFVEPDGKSFNGLVSIDDPGAKNAQPGDKVVVEIISYPTRDSYAQGVITKKLGKSGLAETELKAVIQRYNLRDKFGRSVLQEARKVTQQFNELMESSCNQPDLTCPDNKGGNKGKGKGIINFGGMIREDIRGKTIITIDPADARDFDDAISLRKLAGNIWQLGVHIADVSNFVVPQGKLDDEARTRGTSTYLPRHVVPMLPEILSNGICSLQEGRDRFVKSVYIRFDKNGKVISTRFANSLMRSTCRLTYEQADDILAGRVTKSKFKPSVVNLLKKMHQLALILQKRRHEQGMLNLELPSAELVYNKNGRLVDVQPEDNSFPHTIIELFMIEANEAVARKLDSLNIPFLRRVHPEPDGLVTAEVTRTIKLCGYNLPKKIDRKGIQQLLDSVAGKPESLAINLAVLKSLQKAVYSPVAIGHYALASEHYCHFTSPIRRYPDLTIHRLLQLYIEGKLGKSKTTAQKDNNSKGWSQVGFADNVLSFDALLELGEYCSNAERNSDQAENDLRDYEILKLLSGKVGEDMNGTVTAILNFGVFVQLDKYLVEGLVKPSDVLRATQSSSRIRRHKANKANRGSKVHQSTHKRYSQSVRGGKFIDICPWKIGHKLRVRIIDVDLTGRRLDVVPV